jgi:hypothetical protein
MALARKAKGRMKNQARRAGSGAIYMTRQDVNGLGIELVSLL